MNVDAGLVGLTVGGQQKNPFYVEKLYCKFVRGDWYYPCSLF
jgi:hypothetical protein